MTLGNGGTPVLFNEAVGGTVTEIADYNGTGQTWRVHTFTSSGSLEVLSDGDPNGFRVMVAGGGGGGGYSWHYGWTGGTGGRGQTVTDDALALPVGSHTVTRGGGGGGEGTGGTSSVGAFISAAGGGGATGAGDGYHGQNGSPSYSCVASDISGSTVSCYGGAGGAPGDPNGGYGKAGQPGAVIVAYQIG
jgi:hypothetical protein